MSLFERLKNTFTAGKLKTEQIHRLNESIWNAVADGRIDDRELEYINAFYAESQLASEDFQNLKSDIFKSVVQQAIADRRVTASELNSLNNLIERLEIPPALEKWAEQQVQYYREMARIESGGELSIVNPTGLIMQKNEVCYLNLPASLFEERVTSRELVGGSQGLNIRIMKGVSYRLGQQRGKMVSRSGLVAISDGYFIITNKRIVFSGSRKSVATPLDKLLDVHVFADGLNFSSSTRQKPVIVKLSRPEEAEMCGVIISRLLNESA